MLPGWVWRPPAPSSKSTHRTPSDPKPPGRTQGFWPGHGSLQRLGGCPPTLQMISVRRVHPTRSSCDPAQIFPLRASNVYWERGCPYRELGRRGAGSQVGP